MSILNLFDNDAFSLASMSDAIQKVEYVPRTLGTMQLFTPEPIRTRQVGIELKDNGINLIPLSRAGEPMHQKTFGKGKIITFDTYRVAESTTIRADELAFLRQFGTEAEMLSAAQEEIAARQVGPGGLIDDVDLTLEHMRLGALNGQLIDHDGTVVEDFFDAFGIAQPAEIMFALATTNEGDLRAKVEDAVVRYMRRNAKGARFSRILALCGDEAWDELMKNPEVRQTFVVQQAGQALRDATLETTLNFAGVTWTNYIGTDDGTTVALEADEIRFFPAGAGNTVFRHILSPGETFDDLGTRGKPLYSRLIIDRDRNSWVQPEVMTYPTFLNTRPEMMRRGRSGA